MAEEPDTTQREGNQPPEVRKDQRPPVGAGDVATIATRGLITTSNWLVRHPPVLLAVAAVLVLIVLYVVLSTIIFVILVALTVAAFLYTWLRFGSNSPMS